MIKVMYQCIFGATYPYMASEDLAKNCAHAAVVCTYRHSNKVLFKRVPEGDKDHERTVFPFVLCPPETV